MTLFIWEYINWTINSPVQLSHEVLSWKLELKRIISIAITVNNHKFRELFRQCNVISATYNNVLNIVLRWLNNSKKLLHF